MHEWVTHQSPRGHYSSFTGIKYFFPLGLVQWSLEGRDGFTSSSEENYRAGFLLPERKVNPIPAIRRVTVNKK